MPAAVLLPRRQTRPSQEAPVITQPVAAIRANFAQRAASGVVFSTLSVYTPVLKERLGLNNQQLAWMLAGNTVGSMLTTPLLAPTYKKLGPAKSMVLSASAIAVAFAGIPMHSSAWLAGCQLGLLGSANCLYGGVMDLNTQALHSDARPVLGTSHAMYNVGQLIGGSLASTLLLFERDKEAMVFAGALCLGAGFADLLGRPVGTTLRGSHVERSEASGGPQAALVMLCVIAALSSVAESSIGKWVGVHLSDDLGSTPAATGWIITAMQLATLAGRLASDRYWPHAELPVITVVGGLATSAALGVGLWLDRPIPLAVAAILAAMSTSNFAPAVGRACQKLWPHSARPRVQAWSSGVSRSASLLAAPSVGFLADRLGLRVALGIVVGEGLIKAAMTPLYAAAARAQLAHREANDLLEEELALV